MRMPSRTTWLALLLVLAVCLTEARRKRDGRSKARKPMPPKWKKGPPKASQLAVREGKALVLGCGVSGVKARPSPTFTWTRNGRSLNPGASDKYKQRRWKLTVKNVTLEDGGATFTCTAKNPHGSLNFTFSLRVLAHVPEMNIEVEYAPRNKTAQVGDTVTFLCRSEDHPIPEVYWSRRTNARGILEVMQVSSTDPSVLVVHNVTHGDAGAYSCHISNTMNHRELRAWLTVIQEDEKLPYEPPCELHVRHEMFTDPETGCHSAEPVDLHYCMGTCGRSYSMPTVVLSRRSPPSNLLTQTCRCCVGIVESMRYITVLCPLGRNTSALLPRVNRCKCQECGGQNTEGPES